MNEDVEGALVELCW